VRDKREREKRKKEKRERNFTELIIIWKENPRSFFKRE
jgi:hypothetical protein